MIDFLPLIILVLWIICWFVAAHIADQKQARSTGFFLGFLFGPIGAIMAGFLDYRPSCPRCGGRLNGSTEKPNSICQYCGVDLLWDSGKPLTPELAKLLQQSHKEFIPVSEENKNAAMARPKITFTSLLKRLFPLKWG